ncbi:MAG: IS200/IS605 family transposase [Clostridia bacterium]|nr:IS200/IS605 family transposase [Clostridia bacterium]
MANSIPMVQNGSRLLYHFVCPIKLRRAVFTKEVEDSLVQICAGIEERYDWIRFTEVGMDENHVHFLIQSTPEYAPGEMIRAVKRITAQRIFALYPEVKEMLWGADLWTDGYSVITVGQQTGEETFTQNVPDPGKEDYGNYRQLVLDKESTDADTPIRPG